MSEHDYSADFGTPFHALVQHFESNDIKFTADRPGKSVQFFITGDCAVYSCRFQITHNDDVLQARILLPVSVRDPKVLPLVLETIARANNGMTLGAFDLAVDGGQISFHVGQVLSGGVLEDKLVGGLFLTCMATSDRYFPALMRVIYGGYTPSDAVYLSELDVHAASVDDSDGQESAASPPKPAAKKRRPRRRKSLPSKPTDELPGLTDETS